MCDRNVDQLDPTGVAPVGDELRRIQDQPRPIYWYIGILVHQYTITLVYNSMVVYQYTGRSVIDLSPMYGRSRVDLEK